MYFAGKAESPHVTFDLTSKVVDFSLVYHRKDENENSDGDETNAKNCPSALVILAEEETVVVDLRSDSWPTFHPQPYLNSIHPSAVTCLYQASQVSEEVYDMLTRIGVPGDFSKGTWPITGGIIKKSSPDEKIKTRRDVLVTGHEDGSVRFWNSSSTCLSLITTFSSSVLFTSHEDLNLSMETKEDEEDEWPPFRKVGKFDPYSDDPRLAVKKIIFCGKTGVLVIGGTAGQVVVVNSIKKRVIQSEPSKLEVTSCNLVGDKDGFVWKGHDALDYKPKNDPNRGNEQGEDSFTVSSLLQVQPPAAVTALTLEAPSGVLAVGTAHGVLMFDFFRKKVVMIKSTLNPNGKC